MTPSATSWFLILSWQQSLFQYFWWSLSISGCRKNNSRANPIRELLEGERTPKAHCQCEGKCPHHSTGSLDTPSPPFPCCSLQVSLKVFSEWDDGNTDSRCVECFLHHYWPWRCLTLCVTGWDITRKVESSFLASLALSVTDYLRLVFCTLSLCLQLPTYVGSWPSSFYPMLPFYSWLGYGFHDWSRTEF